MKSIDFNITTFNPIIPEETLSEVLINRENSVGDIAQGLRLQTRIEWREFGW